MTKEDGASQASSARRTEVSVFLTFLSDPMCSPVFLSY